MTVSQYQPAALRTANLRTLDLDEQAFDRLHAAIGLTTEAIELAEAWQSGDMTNLKEEVGDMMWYLPLMCRGLKINLNDILGDEQFGTPPIVVSSLDAILQVAGKLLNIQKKAVAYENYAPTNAYIDLMRTLCRMLAALAERYGFTLQEAADTNIKKLRARYPGTGFDATNAVIRNLAEERTILEEKSVIVPGTL